MVEGRRGVPSPYLLYYYGNLVGNQDSSAASCLDNICLQTGWLLSFLDKVDEI